MARVVPVNVAFRILASTLIKPFLQGAVASSPSTRSWVAHAPARSLNSSAIDPFPAIVFDIDGVLKFGGAWDSRGHKVLDRLKSAGVPFVFMTNGGGGKTEAEYCAEVVTKLAAADMAGNESAAGLQPLALTPEQFILSYRFKFINIFIESNNPDPSGDGIPC